MKHGRELELEGTFYHAFCISNILKLYKNKLSVKQSYLRLGDLQLDFDMRHGIFGWFVSRIWLGYLFPVGFHVRFEIILSIESPAANLAAERLLREVLFEMFPQIPTGRKMMAVMNLSSICTRKYVSLLGQKHFVTLGALDGWLLKVGSLMSGQPCRLIVGLPTYRAQIDSILEVRHPVLLHAVQQRVLLIAQVTFVHFCTGMDVHVGAIIGSTNERLRTVRTLMPERSNNIEFLTECE